MKIQYVSDIHLEWGTECNAAGYPLNAVTRENETFDPNKVVEFDGK